MNTTNQQHSDWSSVLLLLFAFSQCVNLQRCFSLLAVIKIYYFMYKVFSVDNKFVGILRI